MLFTIVNDEPSSVDALDRAKFARAISRVVNQCDTPLVIGLYGTWGVGKTSLMRIVQQQLDQSGDALTVWFDAWQHQFDENPAVALLHTMVDALGLGEEGRRLLRVIAGALGSILLKSSTTLTTSDVAQIQERYDEQRFLIREKQIRLRQHFADLLAEATNNGNLRVVFFVDDLDRCVPEKILEVLEALKLFLNMPGCVYVLGVDRSALETSIKHRYAAAEISEVAYLDKIVQLPFNIPPITRTASHRFISDLLPESLAGVAEDLAPRLGENPRQVKRFVNSLLLNHELSQSILGDQYDAEILAAVLLLQYKNPEKFKEVVRDSTVIVQADMNDPEVRDLLADDAVQYLATTVAKKGARDISPYIFMSEVASTRMVGYDVVLTDSGDKKIQVIKVVRDFTQVGLKEAKDAVDAASSTNPSVIMSNLNREEGEAAVQQLAAAGAKAELR